MTRQTLDASFSLLKRSHFITILRTSLFILSICWSLCSHSTKNSRLRQSHVLISWGKTSYINSLPGFMAGGSICVYSAWELFRFMSQGVRQTKNYFIQPNICVSLAGPRGTKSEGGFVRMACAHTGVFAICCSRDHRAPTQRDGPKCSETWGGSQQFPLFVKDTNWEHAFTITLSLKCVGVKCKWPRESGKRPGVVTKSASS